MFFYSNISNRKYQALRLSLVQLIEPNFGQV
jgi:hypothetical protein